MALMGYITLQHKIVCNSSYIPDDGPVWPRHVTDLHEGSEYALIWPIICEATLKTYKDNGLKNFVQPM
jgi:hypothetical protein